MCPETYLRPAKFRLDSFLFRIIEKFNVVISLGGLRKILDNQRNDMSTSVLKVKEFPLGNLHPNLFGIV